MTPHTWWCRLKKERWIPINKIHFNAGVDLHEAISVIVLKINAAWIINQNINAWSKNDGSHFLDEKEGCKQRKRARKGIYAVSLPVLPSAEPIKFDCILFDTSFYKLGGGICMVIWTLDFLFFCNILYFNLALHICFTLMNKSFIFFSS